MRSFYLRCGQPRRRLDARLKLVLMTAVGAAAMTLSAPGLSALTGLLAAAAVYTRLPIAGLVRESRFFALLLVLVFAARALSTPGEVLFGASFVSFTRQGIYEGALICWRLILMVTAGIMFTAATPLADTKAAIEWFLTPVPGIPQKRIAVLIGLIVRFIPVILFKAGEISRAQHARCIANRKNPLYRLKTLSLPLLRIVFTDAQRLADAMTARGYSDMDAD